MASSQSSRSNSKQSPRPKNPKSSKQIKTSSKVFKLTLPQTDWDVLETFFDKKGLRMATGIKMILRDFIEQGKNPL